MECYNLDESEFSHDTPEEISDLEIISKFEKLYAKAEYDLLEELFKIEGENALKESIASSYLNKYFSFNILFLDLFEEQAKMLQNMGFDVRESSIRLQDQEEPIGKNYCVEWSNDPKVESTIIKWIDELGLSANELKTTYMKIEQALKVHILRGCLVKNAKIKVEIAGNSDKAFSCDIVKAQIVKYLKRYNLKAFVDVEPNYEQNTLICTVYKIYIKGL